MRKKLDDIEIVEPPIGELAKKKSAWLRTCLSGCGCVILVFVAILVALKVFVGPGPKTLRTIPDGLPPSIPVYDRDAIERITLIPSRYKNRGLQVSSFFPKIIFSQLFISSYPAGSDITTSTSQSTALMQKVAVAKNFWSLLTTPVDEGGDTIKIEWSNLTAEPKFVFSYYKKELEKAGYTIGEESANRGSYQFAFSRKNGPTGSLEIQANEDTTSGTDYATLIVNLPHLGQ